MDFVRERRAWEEGLRRRAPDAFSVMDVWEEMDDEPEMDRTDENYPQQAELPSPTEDREIEELLSFMDDGADSLSLVRPVGEQVDSQRVIRQEQTQQSDQIQVQMSDDDSEEYDRLFMEVISASQEQGQGQGHGPRKQSLLEYRGCPGSRSLARREELDSNMDMS